MNIKRPHVICPYCQCANYVHADDLGFEEFECGSCENTFTIPETFEELPEFNKESFNNLHNTPPSHYRVMLRGEDGCESCLKNGVPAEYAELVCAGLQTHYTEGQRCFLEPEETLADLRRMCDDDRGDRYEY